MKNQLYFDHLVVLLLPCLDTCSFANPLILKQEQAFFSSFDLQNCKSIPDLPPKCMCMHRLCFLFMVCLDWGITLSLRTLSIDDTSMCARHFILCVIYFSMSLPGRASIHCLDLCGLYCVRLSKSCRTGTVIYDEALKL